jgi:hypothetical protein
MREYITEVKWLTYLEKTKICYSLHKPKINADTGRLLKNDYAV